MTLMPGWIDTHVHPAWHFDRNGKLHQGREAPETKMTHLAGNALATLMAGFTTVQSLGDPLDGALRDSINDGVLPGPRILTSLGQLNENSGDPETLRQKIRQFKASGADVIKIFATKSIRDGGGQSMTDAQIDAVCGESKGAGTARGRCMRTQATEPRGPYSPAVPRSSMGRSSTTRLCSS
jgi:hypothetical protein